MTASLKTPIRRQNDNYLTRSEILEQVEVAPTTVIYYDQKV
jgi:hypothetical protein